MQISFDTNVLRWYLRDVYFINGTAYAGKSTMVRLLAERYGMIHCGENYHDRFPAAELSPKLQPNLCYFETMSGWEEFLNRTPEEYRRWCEGVAREAVQLEIAELIRLSAQGKKIIADTNIPLEILREISDYSRVAILLSPQAYARRQCRSTGFSTAATRKSSCCSARSARQPTRSGPCATSAPASRK